MLVYIIFFVILGIVAYIWEKCIDSKKGAIIGGISIILIISIFAGCRNENIGTDILVYIKPILVSLKINSLNVVYKTSNIEIGTILLLACTKFWNYDLNVALFLLQSIVSIFVVLYAYKNKKIQSPFIIIMAYANLVFGFSLNLMRQSIAIGILLYSNCYIKESKLKQFILCIILASLFHITAIIYIPVYFVYNGNKNISKFVKIAIFFVVLIILMFIENILSLGMKIGILGSKYNAYLTKYYISAIHINNVFLILKLFMGMICIYILILDKNAKNDAKFYSYLLLIDILLFMLGSKIMFAERLSYYFSTSAYLYCFSRGAKIIKQKYIYYFFTLGLFLIYFYVVFAYLGNSEIIPYKSIILKI